jgi:hypothetical protein
MHGSVMLRWASAEAQRRSRRPATGWTQPVHGIPLRCLTGDASCAFARTTAFGTAA